MIKRLSIIAIILAIVLVPLGALLNLTTNATVTNEMAIDQLNGGDEEYIEAQAYNNYSHELQSLITTCVSLVLTLLFVTVVAIVIGVIVK